MEMEMDWWSIINLVHRTFELRMHYSTEDWASFKNRTICACRRDDDGDWLERLLWWRLYVVRRLLPQSPCWRDSLCLFFLSFRLFMFMCVFFSWPYTILYMPAASVRQRYVCLSVKQACSPDSQLRWGLHGLFEGHRSSGMKSGVSPRSSLIVWLAQCADELSCWFLKTNHSKRV